MSVLYDKGNVQITDEGVLLRWYYFPFAQSKFVPFSEITGIERQTCGLFNSKTWGMPFDGSWWHADGLFSFREFRHPEGIRLITDGIVMGMTPQDVDEVENILKEHIRKTQ